MTSCLLLVTVLAVSAYAAPVQVPNANTLYPIWQGFEAAWQRELFSLPIAHRLSEIGSSVSGTNKSATVAFDAGDDGDYAHPRTYYQLLDTEAAKVSVKEDSVHFNFTDSSDHTNPRDPFAFSQGVFVYLFPLANDHESFGVSFRGFNLRSHCDPAKQPSGKTCSGNAVWISYFNIYLNSCERFNSSAGQFHVMCYVGYYLNRTWSPEGLLDPAAHPYTESIDFTLDVDLTIITGDREDFISWPAGNTDLITNLYDARDIRFFDKAPGRGANSYASVMLGCGEFGWNMVPTSNFTDLPQGRELVGYKFAVGDVLSYDPKFGWIEWAMQAGLFTPKTTVNNQVDLTIAVQVFQFKNPSVAASRGLSASGKICRDSQSFACSTVQMTNQAVDTVPINF